MLRNAARHLFLASVAISFAAAGAFCGAIRAQHIATTLRASPTKAKAARPVATGSRYPSQPQPNQKTFASPQEAASALYSAARGNDENALLVILGPDAREIVMWTDNAEDRKAESRSIRQEVRPDASPGEGTRRRNDSVYRRRKTGPCRFP